MLELIVERTFSAAHWLCDYEGACSRLHGHNYRVEVSVVGQEPGPNGMLMDFGDLKALCDRILGELDHRCLNELPPFATCNPTSENIARHIFQQVQAGLNDPALQVGYVRVWETPGQSAVYREGSR
jgi:6-pyruvoyltetrahydropterin/6-carboxytetrahydropterin synthase